MRRRLLLLCSGQGGQHAGMFELARTHPRARALLDQFDLVVDPALLFSNRLAQPMIVACTLAMWEAIRDLVPAPALVAGYSIGEISAYSVAGILTPVDAVRLAHVRARLMDDCLKAAPGQALAAVSGLSLQTIEALMEGEGFFVAIETGADNCVAGGPAAALVSMAEKIAAAGGKMCRLNVEIASHTPYMAPAVAHFAHALRATKLDSPKTLLLSSISAGTISGTAMAIEHLSRQLAEKIKWMDCMDACAEAGLTVALELGPGSALARMLRVRQPSIDCRSVADFRSIAGIQKWLARHFE